MIINFDRQTYQGIKWRKKHKMSNVESNGLQSLIVEKFSDREKLIDTIRNLMLMEGYVTTIRRLKANSYVILGCDRGGKYRVTAPLDRRTKTSASHLINCPFEVWEKKTVDGC